VLPPGISSTLSPMLPLAVKLHISGCAGAQSAVVWRFRLAHPAREGLTAMPSGGMAKTRAVRHAQGEADLAAERDSKVK